MSLLKKEPKYILKTRIHASGGHISKTREFDTEAELVTQLGKIPISEDVVEVYEKTVIIPDKDDVHYI